MPVLRGTIEDLLHRLVSPDERTTLSALSDAFLVLEHNQKRSAIVRVLNGHVQRHDQYENDATRSLDRLREQYENLVPRYAGLTLGHQGEDALIKRLLDLLDRPSLAIVKSAAGALGPSMCLMAVPKLAELIRRSAETNRDPAVDAIHSLSEILRSVDPEGVRSPVEDQAISDGIAALEFATTLDETAPPDVWKYAAGDLAWVNNHFKRTST